jgi:hypothetical protein
MSIVDPVRRGYSPQQSRIYPPRYVVDNSAAFNRSRQPKPPTEHADGLRPRPLEHGQ